MWPNSPGLTASCISAKDFAGMPPMLLAVFVNLTREWIHHGPIILRFISGFREASFGDFKR
jgi:hypothetical protein